MQRPEPQLQHRQRSFSKGTANNNNNGHGGGGGGGGGSEPGARGENNKKRLKTILEDPMGFSVFQKFLDTLRSGEVLEFWARVEEFKGVTNKEVLKAKAEDLLQVYMRQQVQSLLQASNPSSSSSTSQLLEKINAGEAHPRMFDGLQKTVFAVMVQDLFPRFLSSDHFLRWKKRMMGGGLAENFSSSSTESSSELGAIGSEHRVSQLVSRFGGSVVGRKGWSSRLDLNKSSLLWLEQASLTLAVASPLTEMVAATTEEERDTKLMTEMWARKLYCLSEVLLQPDLRTMVGFQELIRRQWLGLLLKNSNNTDNTQQRGEATNCKTQQPATTNNNSTQKKEEEVKETEKEAGQRKGTEEEEGKMRPLLPTANGETGTDITSVDDLKPLQVSFAQFLDCVGHLCKIYPTAFEFNLKFLQLLIYHYGVPLEQRNLKEDEFWTHVDNNHAELYNLSFNKTDFTVIIPDRVKRKQLEVWNEYYKTWKKLMHKPRESVQIEMEKEILLSERKIFEEERQKFVEERRRLLEEREKMREEIHRLKRRGERLEDLLHIHQFLQTYEAEQKARHSGDEKTSTQEDKGEIN